MNKNKELYMENLKSLAYLQSKTNSGVNSAQVELDRMEKHEATKSAAKSIIGHAVAGGIIAGPAGTVIGGMVGQTKNNKKK